MSAAVHDFAKSLALSNAQVDAPWWEPIYRQTFPDFAAMVAVREDGWAQRGGIDRVITLSSGKTVSVDEKVRAKDWDDVLWEYLSDRDRGTPGWANKALACDFIAYAFIPSQRCYLLPTQQLRRAWLENSEQWIELAEAKSPGFRIVDANNGRYVTRSVAVPLKETMRAVRDALCVRWS